MDRLLAPLGVTSLIAAGAMVAGSCRARPHLTIPPQASSVELTLMCEGPSYVLLGVGDHAQLIPALLVHARGRMLACEAQAPDAVAWTVDDATLARVDRHGRITALAPGHTIVRATADTLHGLREVHILPSVDHIASSSANVRLAVGDTARLVATAYDSSGRVLERLPPLALSYDTDDGGDDDSRVKSKAASNIQLAGTSTESLSIRNSGSAFVCVRRSGVCTATGRCTVDVDLT